MSFLNILRKQGKDLLELIFIPGLAAILPWPVCFRLFRYIAKLPFLYSGQAFAALREAQKMGMVGNPEKWTAAFRLVQLVDHADLYLSRFRSDKWMDRYLTASGNVWPLEQGPFLAITFHWGGGMWSSRHIRRLGLRVATLFRPIGDLHPLREFIQKIYGTWRIHEVERGGGAKGVFTGRNVRGLIEALQKNISIIALLDVPPKGNTACMPVELFGHKAYFPGGLVRFAVARKLPVVAFTLSFDPDTGQRRLMIKGPLPCGSERELMDGLVSMFTEAVRQQPYAWHFWPYLNDFLVTAEEKSAKYGSVETSDTTVQLE